MLASVLLWLSPRVCVLSLAGCQAMLASVLSFTLKLAQPVLLHKQSIMGRHVKAKMYTISSDTPQLQFIKLHHFKLEIFRSI